jgi:glyoxylate reductase
MEKIFISRRIDETGIQLLEEHCELWIQPSDRPATREELLEGAAWADALLVMLSDKIDREVLAKGIKGVAGYAVGYDNIDLSVASELKVGVSNTPDVLTKATAELAWALLFAAARHIVPSDTLMRSRTWKGWAPLQLLGADISGKKLGIIGAGRIGTAMGMMSRGFEMEMLYWNRSASQELDGAGARRCDLEELLQSSDFISLHLPLNGDTRHLIGRKELSLMKPGAILVNTGRGPVLEEKALVRAIKEGTIAGAGLDVYEFEPEIGEELASLEQVVLTPHTGSATYGARGEMAKMAAENLLAMVEGKPGKQCLNPEIYR